ncbi:MAG: opacity protein-like surface antigen [Psychroserpens sp.]|jgi:opacity protein-like surface antigen
MKVKLLCVFALFLSVKAMAQDRNWSLEASYPVNITSSSNSFNIDGVIDFGVKYRFADFKILRLGLGVNGGFYREKGETDRFTNFEVDLKNYFIQPKLFVDLKIPAIPKLHPSLGVGYSVLVYDDTLTDSGTKLTANGSDGGPNINAGLSYDLTNRWFVQGQYDFISIGYKNENDGSRFHDEIGIIKVGLGFRF